MIEELTIHQTTVLPGESAMVKIPVGRIPSGNMISLRAHIFRSENPGPTIMVLAGVHGDEINGVEIVRRALSEGYFKSLQKGNVIAIPILNVFGFINFSRELPDGKDVNRSFPGSTRG
ncbi:MAG: succinylglutamate desuccinylase/aspartoacylase family protein, partial [Saprospiraceae bacterium]|nr:succinylglutamate desuccinylase/aspartoacylase family protein [Saprospiraceae bacterium]